MTNKRITDQLPKEKFKNTAFAMVKWAGKTIFLFMLALTMLLSFGYFMPGCVRDAFSAATISVLEDEKVIKKVSKIIDKKIVPINNTLIEIKDELEKMNAWEIKGKVDNIAKQWTKINDPNTDKADIYKIDIDNALFDWECFTDAIKTDLLSSKIKDIKEYALKNYTG